MAYASLRLPDRIGTELRLVPMIAGIACAIVIPSFLAACVITPISAITSSEVVPAVRVILAGSVIFAGFGLVSVLVPFLPLILWRLPQTRNPRITCMLLGALSGPGPLGYWALPYFPRLALLTIPMGTIGGLIFWFVTVRPARQLHVT
ncbi:MAG: hypothetical protein AVDCRST_MAG91-48 [uncultured Sphingomonadaceae bacterium]|uniref:Uncharacterized protein n=1 Tax=uncultured Sphingomonadaceae bacterium TaxID=169976 RepID=A0A6J4RYE5_9SPHN|nr:MAG: hypothetical protein AVDCRST_MAG91-48 [uncultured Sphingomonadaceae bacterium]